MLYGEHDFLDRFAAAAKDKFRAVEFHFPYAYSKGQLVERLSKSRQKLVLFNLPPGDWDKGERGIACLPGRSGEFQDGVGKAIDYAKALGCKQVNCLAGIVPADASTDAIHRSFIDNLKFAAGALAAENIRLLIEPINQFDMPGFYLFGVGMARWIIDEVGSKNLFIQYDLYHQQRSEGELVANFQRHLEHIKHIQLADSPGRHEPGTGEINYPFVFTEIDVAGYDGWIGCEYKPRGRTSDGLGWIREWARSQ
jgi:hydroxypyruvate isomerase